MYRHLTVLLALLLVSCSRSDRGAPPPVPDAGLPEAPVADAGASATLRGIGPRLFSNQTAQPLAVYGEGLTPGMKLALGPPLSRELPLTVWDEGHAFAVLPGGIAVGMHSEVLVDARLTGADGTVQLRIINDTTFPDLIALKLSQNGSTLFAASTTTDEVLALDLATQQVQRVATLDGPTALALWLDKEKKEWLVVAHRYTGALLLVRTDDFSQRREVPAVANAEGLAMHGDTVFVAEHARDTVVAYALPEGKALWRAEVSLNPRELELAGTSLLVGSLETGAIDELELRTGKLLRSYEPGPGTAITGGTTVKYSKQIMNGKAPRALAWSAKSQVLYVSSIGPNIGPNADKMEVSMNGGVGAVVLKKGWREHKGFGAGVPEALAVDDERGLLYISDMGLGVVRVLSQRKLELQQTIELNPPASFPLVRAKTDFGVKGRAGISLHTGPRALALSADKKTLYVLERFTGAVAIIDVSPPLGKAAVKAQLKLTDTLAQRTRRQGQVLFHADLGRTAMSCDACHIEGHNEGVLFEKTMPLRIYRSTTVRGSRETPPFFTPASTRSMGETAKVVGGRNRYHNPDPSPAEIEALTLYAALIPNLPNPFLGADGAPVEILTLPDGKTGRPREGMKLFEGKAGCLECHPPPLYTLDQSPDTRARFIDVGTPQFMPLRVEQQNVRFEGMGIPSLAGSWDVFPMLSTGMAGLGVKPDGSVRVTERFALRMAVEQWAPTHGRADLLSPQERDDLLAWLMSL